MNAPSQGALRAAKLMAISPKVRQLALGLILREEFSRELAEIIDRETAAPEMLEALESLPLNEFGEDMENYDAADFVDNSGEFFDAMIKARAAIRKARGAA